MSANARLLRALDPAGKGNKVDMELDLVGKVMYAMGYMKLADMQFLTDFLAGFRGRCCLECLRQNLVKVVLPLLTPQYDADAAWRLQTALRGVEDAELCAVATEFWRKDPVMGVVRDVFSTFKPCAMGQVLCCSHLQERGGKAVKRYGTDVHGVASYCWLGCPNRLLEPSHLFCNRAFVDAFVAQSPHEVLVAAFPAADFCCSNVWAMEAVGLVVGFGCAHTVERFGALEMLASSVSANSPSAASCCTTPSPAGGLSVCPGAPLFAKARLCGKVSGCSINCGVYMVCVHVTDVCVFVCVQVSGSSAARVLPMMGEAVGYYMPAPEPMEFVPVEAPVGVAAAVAHEVPAHFFSGKSYRVLAVGWVCVCVRVRVCVLLNTAAVATAV